jgi:hypothetical protein
VGAPVCYGHISCLHSGSKWFNSELRSGWWNQVHPRSETKDILHVKSGPFLVVTQLPVNPSSVNLWHAIDISQNCLSWTKAYTHVPSNASQVSPSVAHVTASEVSSFVASFGRPSRSLSPMLSLPLLNSADHFSQCYRNGTPFKVYPWSLHGFPLESSLSYRGT